jgi:hypothetical protein
MAAAPAKSASPPVGKPAAKPPALSSVPRPAGGNSTTSPTQRKTAKEGGATARKSATPTADTTAGAPSSAGGMSAAEKARLAAVDHRAGQNKSAQTTHQSAAEASDEARAAAKEPQKEADGRALGEQAEVLEQNPPPDPDLVRRIANIKADIQAKRPLKEEDLPKADPKEMAAAAGKEVSGDVKSAAAGVQTGYAPVDQKPTGTPSKDAVPIAPDAPPPAAPLPDAAAAAPDPVQASQASIDADKRAAAAKAKDAKLDRPEAALVKDGPVAEARAAQDDVNHAAIWGPDAVVKSSKEIQASAATDFKKAEADALKQMKAARAKQLAGVQGSKGDAKTGEEGKREALGKRLAAIYDDAQMRVHAKLQPLVPTALKMWDDGIAPLSDNFDHALGRVDEYIKGHKEHWYNRLGDALLGLPQWIVDEYELAESKFVEGAGALALTISSWVNGVIRDCQKVIADGRKAIQKELAGLDPELQAYALEEQKKIDKQFDGLTQEVVTAKSDFTKQLTQRLVSAIKEKDEQIQKLREMSKGLLQQFEDFVSEFIDDPLRAIINGLLRIVGIPPDQFWALVDKFAKVVDQIIDKPMVFANNLLAAIKLGFQQFKDNILSHLIAGLLNWLTSKLKDAGVEAPKDLSLKSMLTLFLQILGITWPKIRVKIVKYIGEKNMRRIELAWEFLKAFINDGWDGVWKLIKEKLDPQQLVDIVLNAVKSFIVESIVKKAAEYIVSLLNPAGVIYQALKLIYEAVTWIMDNASKIFTLIQSIVDGAANIMSGAIGGAANLIEKALGALVPIVIDLFAKLVGLGGVPDKVKEVVGGLQEMVSNAIDKVIEWVATKIGLTKDEDKKDGDVGERIPFEAGTESHSLWIKVEGTNATVMIASTPTPLMEWLSLHEAKLPEGEKKTKATPLFAEVRALSQETDLVADKTAKEKQAPEGGTSAAAEGDNETLKSKERTLVKVLAELVTVLDIKLDGPMVGTYDSLKKRDDFEKHHVPPKGVANWLNLAIESIQKKADIDVEILNTGARAKNEHGAGGPNLSSISIHKFTHIKIDPNATMDYRAHHGKDTQRAVEKILRDKYHTKPILKSGALALSPEDVAEAVKDQAEGPDNTVVGKASTQFYMTELNAALKEATADEVLEVQKFLDEVKGVFYTAWIQSLSAVRVAVEKSVQPGDPGADAVDALPPKAQETWGLIDPGGKVTRF